MPGDRSSSHGLFPDFEAGLVLSFPILRLHPRSHVSESQVPYLRRCGPIESRDSRMDVSRCWDHVGQIIDSVAESYCVRVALFDDMVPLDVGRVPRAGVERLIESFPQMLIVTPNCS